MYKINMDVSMSYTIIKFIIIIMVYNIIHYSYMTTANIVGISIIAMEYME